MVGDLGRPRCPVCRGTQVKMKTGHRSVKSDPAAGSGLGSAPRVGMRVERSIIYECLNPRCRREFTIGPQQ